MQIRKAAAEEMLALWGYPDLDTAPPTARFFYHHISCGNALFWALDHEGELAGELYAFLNLEDKDFADGQNTAYLCAFRIRKEYRGQGYGRKLLETAFAELKDRGFRYAAIGVSCDEPHNIRLYQHLGFDTKIRDCHYDPCDMDENMQPVYDEYVWWLLRKDL